MFIFKLGTANTQQQASFLFHQSLQKILLRLKNRDSFLSGSQLLTALKGSKSHIEPPLILQYLSFCIQSATKMIFCVENQVKTTYLVVAILKKPVIVFCLSPQHPPTRELQMLCFKNSQRVFIKCFDSNGF